jgi:hypothetical protein
MEQLQTQLLPYTFTESQLARLAVYKAAVAAGYFNEGFVGAWEHRGSVRTLEPRHPSFDQEPGGR